jgi:chloride channel protein, CIC family
MWALAVLVGAMAALAVVFLRNAVSYAEFLAFNAPRGRLSSHLAALPWWSRMLGFIVGGSIIALLLRLGISMGWGPAPRAFGLTDIVQHRRLRGTIGSTTLSLRDSFLSTLVSIVSLGWGGSAGREEPAAHLGGALGMLPGRLLGLDTAARRLLVGMGVAAAIAAALHAPITGALLARELVLRRFRVSALGPVVVASFAGWLVARAYFDGRPVIEIPSTAAIPPDFHLAAILAIPILALVAWVAVGAWSRAPVVVAAAAGRIRLPLWLLPFVGGVLLGVLALAFPQVLGISYEPLAAGLAAKYAVELLPILVLAKIGATAITFGFRWGGGAIAPALFVGGLAGSALGVGPGLLLGDAASAQVYFGMLGMAAVVAVLLDAPLTAGVLVLELSGSPEIGAAGLVCAFAVSMAVRRLLPQAGEETEASLRWR